MEVIAHTTPGNTTFLRIHQVGVVHLRSQITYEEKRRGTSLPAGRVPVTVVGHQPAVKGQDTEYGGVMWRVPLRQRKFPQVSVEDSTLFSRIIPNFKFRFRLSCLAFVRTSGRSILYGTLPSPSPCSVLYVCH